MCEICAVHELLRQQCWVIWKKYEAQSLQHWCWARTIPLPPMSSERCQQSWEVVWSTSVMSAHCVKHKRWSVSMQKCLYLSNCCDVFSCIDTCSIAPLIHTEELNLSVYYSRLDWHSESEGEKRLEEKRDGGEREERKKDQTRTGSADRLGGGRK